MKGAERLVENARVSKMAGEKSWRGEEGAPLKRAKERWRGGASRRVNGGKAGRLRKGGRKEGEGQ
jgi:hypothetical protein